MNRCVMTAALALCCALPAWAQRIFPPDALRGKIAITQPPNVQLNGDPARLSPGSRIYGANNLIQLPGTLLGQQFIVNYTIDISGQIGRVWILSDAEAAVSPWPSTLQEARAWRYSGTTGSWTKP
ncbi:MAG: hypothetical protein KGN16_08145 [Burkholderiales bacterium]|nr:hypothetical protein [Burkholderiales bacterium]